MLKTIKSTLFFFLLLLSLSSIGQIFPVQVTTQMARPYSLYLSDYTAPGSERLTVNIFLTDVSRTDLNIRLRLRIEGQGIKVETKPEYVPPILTVHGGTPLQLISADLADYFDPRNLNFSGITQREYQQRGALPEGFYQFCFEVYEYNRNVKISNASCASAWLILNDPPLINLPRDNEKVRIQDPQQVIFQWTPRHTGSPNAAFTTEYDFKLVEVWPSTRNPNDAILTSPPIYETTTTSTTLVYGAAETPLEPGRRYAFQVKAHSIAGVNELNLFKNNGLSQVSSFVFGDACVPPQNIVADVTGATRFTAAWDAGVGQTGYNVRYRAANGGEWYRNNTINPDIEIKSLQPNTTYEYQVSATCGILESPFSPVATITTKGSAPVVYSCGLPLSPFDLDQGQLLDVLKVGDIIQAGDFDVNITKVTGGHGSFSGEGVIQVSYFNQAKVKAEFSNITVNKEMRMVDGYMNVTGAGVDVIPGGVLDFMDELSESMALLDSAITKYEENLPKRFDPTVFVADKLIVIPGAIVSVTPAPGSSGGVVIIDDKGNKQTVPPGTSVAITDSNGKGYIVDKNGGIHETTAAIATKAGKREYNLALKFSPATDQTFGFDELGQKTALANTYDKIDGKYDVAWKSVATGQTDKVQAILEGSGIDKSKVRFEQFGLPLTPVVSPTNNTISLIVNGTVNGTTEGIVALYTPNDTTKKEQVLGQLNVVTYNEIPKTVFIVPVNDGDGSKLRKVGDQGLLQSELNKIYGQAVVRWTVNFGENINVPGIEPFEDGGTGLLSNYTSHMHQVIRSYKANMQPNTYYLFLVSNPKNPGTLGVMPRSKESGFIFVDKHADAAAIVRTIAHELGHGAFNLHHTFSEPKLTQTKGTTDNLMDYPAGDKLYKFQWDKMRYPDIVVGLFEDDEEGASYRFVIDDKFLNKDEKTFSFLTYNGRIISVEKEKLTDITLNYGTRDFKGTAAQVPGVLQSFTLGDVTYTIDLSDGIYKSGGIPYQDVNTLKTDEIDGVIFGLPCNNTFSVYKFDKGSLVRYTGEPQDNYVNDVVDFPFRPFKTNIAISKNGAVLEQPLTKVAQDGCYWCIDQSTAVMTKEYCQRPEIIYITKIAQYRVAFPADFRSFTSINSDWANPAYVNDYKHPIANADESISYPQIPNGFWGDYLSKHPDLKNNFEKGVGLEAFFQTMYTQLYSFIDRRVNESANFWDNISLKTPVTSVILEVNKLGFAELEAIPLEKRKIALQVLMEGSIPESKEDAIISVVASVQNQTQRQELVDYIASTFTFSKVISEFHDFFGKDNYTKVITVLSSYINTEGKSVSTEKLERAFNGEQVTIDIGVFNDQSSYTIDKNTIKFTGKRTVAVPTPVGTTARIDLFDLYEVNYDELVPVRFATDCNIGNLQFKKNELRSVPAFYACLLLDKGNQESLKKQGWLVVDGVLFAVGVGEVKVLFTAGNWLRKLMVAGDLIGSGTNLLLDAGLESKLPPDVVHKWRVMNLAASLPLGISSLKNLAGDLITRSRAAKSGLNAAEQAQLEKNISKLEEQVSLGNVVNASDEVLEEINRIKNLRKLNPTKRIEELGADLDKSAISLAEGNAGFEIEEQYGYFKRFKSTPERKGDWESLSGDYKGKTFDEIGGSLGENALSEFARKASQKTKFFESIDLHFTKADYVVLNLTEMKRLQPKLYEETLSYVFNKYGDSKLINITK